MASCLPTEDGVPGPLAQAACTGLIPGSLEAMATTLPSVWLLISAAVLMRGAESPLILQCPTLVPRPGTCMDQCPWGPQNPSPSWHGVCVQGWDERRAPGWPRSRARVQVVGNKGTSGLSCGAQERPPGLSTWSYKPVILEATCCLVKVPGWERRWSPQEGSSSHLEPAPAKLWEPYKSSQTFPLPSLTCAPAGHPFLFQPSWDGQREPHSLSPG